MTDGPIRVMVVDDDAMVRASLRVMLEGADDIEVAHLVADAAKITDDQLDDVELVLMDIVMTGMDGLTATAMITARDHPPAVIVLTTFDADAHILDALHAGATGFLLKDTAPEQIVDAIRRVADGEPMLSASVTRRLIDRVRAETGARAAARQRITVLSERESEIARAIAKGLSNTDIAAELHISVATVKTHIGQIFAKLHLTSRMQLALLVLEADRHPPDDRPGAPTSDQPARAAQPSRPR